MRIVDDPIEDCVCDGGFSDNVMPLCDGKLRGDERRFPAITFFEDFQQVEALLIRERVGFPVIEDQQLNAGEFVDQSWKAAVEPGKAKVFEQTRHAQIQDGMIEPAAWRPKAQASQVFPVPVWPVMIMFSCAFNHTPCASVSSGFAYPAEVGRQVFCGIRQSIPSSK